MKFNFWFPTLEDVEKISPKECFSVGEVGCVKDLVRLSMGNNEDSIAIGFGDNKNVYGVAGSYRQWSGSSQAWAIFDKSVDKYPIELTKVCDKLIKYAQYKQDLRRLSITTKCDYVKGNNFIKMLGFDFEGKLLKFLPDGKDANIYARIF